MQKLNVVQDMLHLGARPRLVSTVKLCHFWVNTYFVALGLSCPLTHTVTEVRERRSSRSSRQEAGGPTGLRLLLGKTQIDRAAGDESGRFPGDFTVELLLKRWSGEEQPWCRGGRVCRGEERCRV